MDIVTFFFQKKWRHQGTCNSTAEKMTQLTKCLSIKHEDQSSISSTFVKCWSCQYSPATPTIAPDRYRCIIDVHYPVRLAKSMIFFSSYGPCLKEDGERSRKVSLDST